MKSGFGDRTVARLLGEKWGRILPISLASAYVKLTPAQFMAVPEYAALIRDYPGVEKGVDRMDLDNVINDFKSGKQNVKTRHLPCDSVGAGFPG